MRYLDPKADLTFKKVFGEHPDLVISFLNALLPFENADEEISSVEYVGFVEMSNNPLRKDSLVDMDVRCKDRLGRQFIVEMQMMWTSAYKHFILIEFSSLRPRIMVTRRCKCCVKQLGVSVEIISQATGLGADEIAML